MATQDEKSKDQDQQPTPYASAYAGIPSQVAEEQRRVDAQRMQRDKMYNDLRDQGHTNDSARLMVDSYYAQNKTPFEEQNERNALAINFVREGHDPMTAQQLANQTYGMQKQSMQLKNQWTALSMQQAQQDLADKQRQLAETSRLTQMKSELGAINHNDLNSSKKLEDITSRYSDVLASPRKEVKDEAAGILNNAWSATGDAQKLWYTEAEKDGIPVKQLGGIPREALDENGIYNSDKGRAFADKYHAQQLELEKKAEQQKAFVSEKAREEYRQFLENTPEAVRKRSAMEAKERLVNQSMLAQQLKGVPQNMLDIEPSLTKGKTKLYYASRDKTGNVVADPNGDLVIYEDKSNPKKPASEIFSRDTWENLKNVKAQYSGGSRNELTEDKAMEYYNAAGGDKEKAREMAKQDGYTF